MTVDIRGFDSEVAAGVVNYPKAQGYGVRVGSLWLRLAPSREQPLRYYTRDSLAERNDDQGSIFENVLDIGYVWERTQWDGGRGLDWDPRQFTFLQAQAQLDQIRFWDSKNIDVSRSDAGEFYTLNLSNIFAAWDQAQADTLMLDAAGGRMWRLRDVATNLTLEAWDNWDDGTPVIEQTGITQANAVDIAAGVNGEVMFITDEGANNTIYSYDSGTVSALVAQADGEESQRVFHVKGRFLTSGVLFNPTPASEADSYSLTERSSNHAWTGGDNAQNAILIDTARAPFYSVVDGGPAIVAACGDGTLRSYNSDSNGALIVASRTDVPRDEYPVLLGANAGVLLVLTAEAKDPVTDKHTIRLYRGEVLDARFDYTIGNLQLMREWKNVSYDIDDPEWRMGITRDEIWFIIPEQSETDTELAHDFLYRFDVVTGGLSRHVEVTDTMKRVISWDSELGVFASGDVGLYRQSADYAVDGWIIGPNITFGLNTDINWVATVFESNFIGSAVGVDPGLPGAVAELYRSSDPDGILDSNDESWVLTQRLTEPGQSGLETPLVGVSSRTLALQVRLSRPPDVAGISPAVTRTAIRGLPSHRDWILEVPVNISDHIEVPHRLPLSIPNYGDGVHNAVLDLQGQHVEVAVIDPPMLFRGVVDAILEPVEYISDRGSAGRYAVIQFRGKRLTATATAVGDAGLGIGLLGVTLLGVGQTGATA